MSNLKKEIKPATCKRPKMSHFKMGLQVKTRTSKRISDKVDQILYHNGKAIVTTITYCYVHSDGILSGRVKLSGKLFEVTKKDSLWTIKGELK